MEKTLYERETCPACKGLGELKEKPTSRDMKPPPARMCPRCNGCCFIYFVHPRSEVKGEEG